MEVSEEKRSWKCDCRISSVPLHKPVSIPMFHNTPPTPNNNIAITLNHTVLSQPPWGKVWDSGMNLILFLYHSVRMAKRLHFWPTFVFLWRKKMLPYISASHLVCIGETMQSTSECQWRFWRVTAWRMQERLSFFFFFLCAGICR